MIKMIVLDVDGTLTNGKISLYQKDSEVYEIKSFNIKDGLGIVKWIKHGGIVAIISGRKCELTRHRFSALGAQEIFLGIEDKLSLLKELAAKYNFKAKNIACIGDDENDLGILSFCKYKFAPRDCAKSLKGKAKILSKKGGEGAVREMIDIILESR